MLSFAYLMSNPVSLVAADMWLHMHLSGCKHTVKERCELLLQT